MELKGKKISGVSKKTNLPYEFVELYVEIVLDGEPTKVQLEVSKYSSGYKKALEKRLVK